MISVTFCVAGLALFRNRLCGVHLTNGALFHSTILELVPDCVRLELSSETLYRLLASVESLTLTRPPSTVASMANPCGSFLNRRDAKFGPMFFWGKRLPESISL